MPPIPQKVVPGKPAPNGAPKSGGSLLAQARPVSEVVETYVRMCLYGPNRTGKTTLACQFPKPAIILSLEPNKTGGAISVTKIPGVDYLRIDESAKVVQLGRELKTDTHYKTVIVDSATALQDLILKEILNLPEIPAMLQWGTASMDDYRARSEKCRECLRPFTELEKHVIIIAKERDHNATDKSKPTIVRGLQLESFFAADLGGATVGWLQDACDYIARLYVDKEVVIEERSVTLNGQTKVKREEKETGKTIRRLRTMFHPNYAAGFRSANPEAVPEYIEAHSPKDMYDAIMTVVGGQKTKFGKY